MDGSRRTGCLENTRTDVLKLVIKWATDPTSTQRVLWLHGPAGSGKSTISTTLADHFRRSKQLGAFVFFDRDVTERSNPTLVARTLAYQLSSFHPDIGALIVATIESSPQTLISSISSQFQELLIDPLSSIQPLPTKTRIVLVLDGLDECGTTQDRTVLVKTLAEQSAHLPSVFRLVITSRPDVDIRLAFESQPHVLTIELDLTSTACQEDILRYFRHHMDLIQRKKRYLGKDWPGEKTIYALARRAAGLFVWASIACSFIDAHDPRKRLDVVLQGDTTSTAGIALDALYRTALEFSGAWEDEDFITDFRAIIGMIIVLRNPLTSVAIDNLLVNPDGRPSAPTIEQLSCVVSSNPVVRLIHPSLADFFTSRTRCGRDIWFFTPAVQERNLAILCLRRLDEVLHYDMSQLTLLVNKDDETIPEDVTYACVFWVDHICMIKDDVSPIDRLLKSFIDNHILHWFEAMSLLKRFNLAITLLDQLSNWIQNHHSASRKSLTELVRYWWRFAREYETYIQERPLQVYSQELLQEFKIIEVQEPLISKSPNQSIFNLPSLSQSSLDISSPQHLTNTRASQSASPYLPEPPPMSDPASSDFTRYSWRLSRSSLNLSSLPHSDGLVLSPESPSSSQDSLGSSIPSRPASPSDIHPTGSIPHGESVDITNVEAGGDGSEVELSPMTSRTVRWGVEGRKVANMTPEGELKRWEEESRQQEAASGTASSWVEAGASTSSNPGSSTGESRSDRNGTDSTTSFISKTYSFISLPGKATKKRPRRRYNESEQLYKCSWHDCTKAYGTLNHLNAHIIMRKHGSKRTKNGMLILRNLADCLFYSHLLILLSCADFNEVRQQ
jgi:hypothetical protein